MPTSFSIADAGSTGHGTSHWHDQRLCHRCQQRGCPLRQGDRGHLEQQFQRTAEANADGFYTLNALPPGTYSITVEKSGFERVVRSGAELTVNQNLRVDFALQVGQMTQEVTVTAQPALVDTRSGALSGLVDDRRVVDLPLNGRNVISLAATIPGIVSVNSPQQLTDARSGPTMNVNGSLETQNLFTFNGGIFVNPSRQTGMNYPPPDAVKEFNIQVQGFSAEYGRNAGSQVSVVSKSGTNQLHGAAWEFLRNDDLNARNFFSATVPFASRTSSARLPAAHRSQQAVRLRLLPGHAGPRRRAKRADHRTL